MSKSQLRRLSSVAAIALVPALFGAQAMAQNNGQPSTAKGD